MTWDSALETEHPSGRKRDVIQVTCDASDCWAWQVVGRHDGDAEKIQRLLLKRGWSFTTVTDGSRDLCPRHRTAAA